MSFKKHVPGYVFNVGKKVVQFLSGQGKTTGKEGIKFIKPEKNLTTKRNIQDRVVKAVDKGVNEAEVPPSVRASQKTKQYASETKRKKSKELKGLSYRYDKLTENKASGGRVGRRFGGGITKKKSNIKKIQEVFGPKKNKKLSTKQMKIAKLAGNPNRIDAADFAKLRKS